jgi:hypothetical protein
MIELGADTSPPRPRSLFVPGQHSCLDGLRSAEVLGCAKHLQREPQLHSTGRCTCFPFLPKGIVSGNWAAARRAGVM